MSYTATLLMQEFVTHDTHRLILSRPDGLEWRPGQGLELRIDQKKWRDQARPFTPTSLVTDSVLEFIIKRYPREGITEALHELKADAKLLLSDAFGTITYQGPGTFIAAGTGITPFLAILRNQAVQRELADMQLFFSNKSERDLICGEELQHLLPGRCIFTYTREHDTLHEAHPINAAFLRDHINNLQQHFYVCGPKGFVESVCENLITQGVHPDLLIYER